MKLGITVAVLSVLFLGPVAVSAQDTVRVERTLACTINLGYTMADVVETARNFEWSEDSAPGIVVMRNKVAAAGFGGNFGPQYDFLISSYYQSYADMVEKRGAFLQRRAASNGRRGLAGVATCNDNVGISSMRVAALGQQSDSPIPPLTAAASTFCELNGATMADAVAMAGRFEQSWANGATALVTSRSFGGPSRPINSVVGMTLIFPSFADFGAAWDRLNQNSPANNAENPISCNSPSLWAQYLIHQGNN